jgi:hypothetical protein
MMELFVPPGTALEGGDSDIRVAAHLTITDARDLLDWLEVHGIRARDVAIEPDGYMSVRWQIRQNAA